MVLNRLGNKRKIANKIIQYFPEHSIYIEPFFGAGGMFFNKPKAKYNVVNDLDSEVFNLFQVVSHQKKELEDIFLQMPISEDLWNFWKATKETEPVRKALRFLFFSNYGYLGKSETLRSQVSVNTSQILYENLTKTQDLLFGCKFFNKDFRVFLKTLGFIRNNEKSRTFIYCDPPYIDTDNNYEQGFTYEDTADLFQVLTEIGCKFAVSEFDDPKIIELAKSYNLRIEYISRRKNIKNYRNEILIMNYDKMNTLF
jgi:DNA adenine methylase